MKHRVVHFVQKYLSNPPIKILFAIGIVPPGYSLLETIGRKTGKPRHTPVGDGRLAKQFWIVAEHGMKAAYVRNIENNPRVRLKLREGLWARWYTGNVSFPKLIRSHASAGFPVNCRAALGMRQQCACSAHTAHSATTKRSIFHVTLEEC